MDGNTALQCLKAGHTWERRENEPRLHTMGQGNRKQEGSQEEGAELCQP